MPTNYYFSQDQINAIDAIFLNPPTDNVYADRYDAILSIIQQPCLRHNRQCGTKGVAAAGIASAARAR